MPTMHHVNLCVPEAEADAEAEWLIDVLGYERAAAGPEATAFGTLRWFQGNDGHQVHLTIDPEHKPSARAHTAIRLDDALDTVVTKLEAAGKSSHAVTFDGDRHVFTNDPAGNLWELIGPPGD